jgi:mannan endo-1,4-beta-mannosidase
VAHGGLPVVQISPGRTSMRAIAAGRYDRYLRSFAEQVKEFGRPVVLGFGREMNGGWYPWGEKHLRPRVWIAAWRHLVEVFRRCHASNVTWQWTINSDGPGIRSPLAWWPGRQYVGWVGIDGYYYDKSNNFDNVFGSTITTVRRLTGKPIIISEVGMSPHSGPVAQMPGLFEGIRSRHLLGLVWFDARARRDWRLENNRPALAAFRRQLTGLRR